MVKDEGITFQVHLRIEKSEWLKFKKLSTTGKSKIAANASEALRKLVYDFNRSQ